MAPLWEFPPVPSACPAVLQPRRCVMQQQILPPATSGHSLVWRQTWSHDCMRRSRAWRWFSRHTQRPSVVLYLLGLCDTYSGL
ncbi:hypothetical protein CGRA01v4_14711 [Colletotrichum graminicola]|nr:hypothetical protein CGRA01v4_14711 [Colletotrichum graminicola]